MFVALFKCSFCPRRFTTFICFISFTHFVAYSSLIGFLQLLLFPRASIQLFLNTMYQTSTLNLWGCLNTKPYIKYTKLNIKLSSTIKNTFIHSYKLKVTGFKVSTLGRVRNCLDAHLGQIVCDKDGVVDWCLVLMEMILTRFE